MIDERLYIDDELVDLGSETKIILNIQSNLFRDVTQIASNSTYSVRLPKTPRNKRILNHIDMVQEKGEYAYKFHRVRYFRNGLELIRDGRVTILKVTEKDIEVSIFWGLFSNFSTIVNAGLTLNKLESKDRIAFKRRNKVATYEEALKSKFFYAKYNPLKYEHKEYKVRWKNYQMREKRWYELWLYMMSPDWNYNEGDVDLKKVNNDHNEFLKRMGLGDNAKEEEIEYLHPVAKASYVLDLIRTTKNVDFQFKDEAHEYVDNLIMPLINKKANKLTFDGILDCDLMAIDEFGSGYASVQMNKESSFFKLGNDGNKDILTVAEDVILHFEGVCKYEFKESRFKSMLNGLDYDLSIYEHNPFYLSIIVKKDGEETKRYFIGENGYWKSDTNNETMELFCYGRGEIGFKKDSEVTFYWSQETTGTAYDTCTRFSGGKIIARLPKNENVPYGGFFPIAHNLPNIKITDFVKFLSVITGTFPKQNTNNNTVEFVPFNTIWKNKAKALDWTARIMRSGEESKPKDITFVVSGYAQNNWYKWKEDEEALKDKYNGNLTIDNKTLELSKVIFQFPFVASSDDVPMYKYDGKVLVDEEGYLIEDFWGSPQLDPAAPQEDKERQYSACKDRIFKLKEDSNKNAVASFDFDMQEIIETKYKNLRTTLQKAKFITERVKIRDIELVDFDETKPIYLAQYGSYFAVVNIKSEGAGFADVTFLQLYFN